MCPNQQSPLLTANQLPLLASYYHVTVSLLAQLLVFWLACLPSPLLTASSATVYCLPGVRASDTGANLRVLASGREKQGTQRTTTLVCG